MSTFSPLRAGLVLTLIASLLLGMSGRVAYLQTYGRQKTIRSAERQQHTSFSIMARRGSVFDSNGYAMATTIQTLSLYIDPKFMLEQYQRDKHDLNQMDEDLRKLCRLVDADNDTLTELMNAKAGSRYLKVAEHLDDRVKKEIEGLKIPGVAFEPVCERYYPMGAIASHVLGSVGKDGQGLEGLELKYQTTLAGRNGFKRIEKDAGRRTIGIDAEDYVPPTHGQHLVLTIDANIQMLAEEELFNACQKYQAERGEVIVIDPRTGHVLAMANYPTFNPQVLDDSVKEDRRNSCLVMPYEPGSTLKPFIVGPALAGHHTRMNEVWPIHAITYNPYGSRVVTDSHFYGQPLCTWDVLVKSSNIGMSMLAERMGNAVLHKSLTAFGFGSRTGVELPGENGGRVNPLKKWSHYSTESVAQGYELMVTPMQLARAFCVYANGGRLINPRLVKGMLDAEGNVIPQQREASLSDCPQVIDPAAALQVRQILSDVVVRGTAASHAEHAPCRSKYWNIFGKTGTAHISNGAAGYASNLYNSSFICGAPLEDPRVVVTMVIHKPDRSLGYFGGTVSAPAACKLMERTLGYLQVPQSAPLSTPPAEVVPHLVGFNPKLYLLQTAGMEQGQ